ncbi:hypothetical protein [Streptomyces sp. NPDC001205]
MDEYRCTVRAALHLQGQSVELLTNSHGTPSPVLAASWLRAQVDWCAAQLGAADRSADELRAWLANETAQWTLYATLTASQCAHVRVCQGASTVELRARRVIAAPVSAAPSRTPT